MNSLILEKVLGDSWCDHLHPTDKDSEEERGYLTFLSLYSEQLAESRFDPSGQSLTPLQPRYAPTGHSPPPRVCLALYIPLHRLPLTSCDTRLSICPFFQLDGEPLRAGAMSYSTCIPDPAQWLLPKC